FFFKQKSAYAILRCLVGSDMCIRDTINNKETLNAYEGRQYCNVLQIPVLFSFRVGIAEIAQIQLDCGPYYAWGFGGKVN
ncbi:MAG: hypothetical protein K2M98_03550, partial [Muribaculum sp.]|nr:hypothetical protein [Muribaculum sp.]